MHPVRYFLFVMLLAVLLPSGACAAAFTIDASVREVYEENVDPLLSGPARQVAPVDDGRRLWGARIDPTRLADGKPTATDVSDLYTVLTGAAGGSSVVGVEAEATIKAEVSRYQFSKFTELNATRAGLRVSVFKQFSDMNSAQLGLAADRTVYHESALNSRSYGAAAEVRHQLTARFWIGEGIVYEQNNADEDFFSFTGRAVLFRIGYKFGGGVAASAGYEYLLRKFDSGAQTKLHGANLIATWKLISHVHAFTSFEHQAYEYGPEHVRDGNNISSIGMAISY